MNAHPFWTAIVRPILVPAALCLLSAAPAVAISTVVDVVVDMSPAGRKVSPPTPAHPAYYIPILGGYLQRGAVVANQPPPPAPNEVASLVARALAKQGYLVMNRSSSPTIILSIFWGCMNPDTIKTPHEGGGQMTESSGLMDGNFNDAEELSLVAGQRMAKDAFSILPNIDRTHVMQAAGEGRYFIMVFAYDYRHYLKTHQKLVLWQAKMSVPSRGFTLGDVLPMLAAAGGPQFGRETTRPVFSFVSVADGHVTVGQPTVVGYPQSSAASPANP